jgi:SAM-dependent methyltransferase
MPGSLVLDAENSCLAPLLSNVFGYHLLLVGSRDYLSVLHAARVQHCTWLMTPGSAAPDPGAVLPCSSIRGLAGAMPVASDSIDIVVLPHVIEFEENPHDTLRETERVLVPEGRVIVAGYNALGLMGAWSLVRRRDAPWNGRFYTASRVRDWLSVLGFDTVASEGCFFRPPLPNGRVLRQLQVFETAGPRFWPRLCGTWFLVARKRIATPTPLRPSWRRRRKPIREAGLAGPAMTERGRFLADDAA